MDREFTRYRGVDFTGDLSAEGSWLGADGFYATEVFLILEISRPWFSCVRGLGLV